MRIFLPLASLMMLVVVACGNDDDGGVSATPTDAASASTPTAPLNGGTPRPTFRPIAADYYAVSGPETLGLFVAALDEGETAQAVPDCTYDETDLIIDCTVAGVGTIALNVAPAGVVTECRGLIKPTNNRVFAASCSVEAGSAQLYIINE